MSCPADKIRNPATGRCVSRTGKIGKAILAGKPAVVKRAVKPAVKRAVKPEEEDWTKIRAPIKRSPQGFLYFVLPKGTVLWHGTSKDFPDSQLPRAPGFYSNLPSAGFYAFREKYTGMDGKIIQAVTTKPLKVMQLNVWYNIERLGRLYPDLKEDLDNMFEYDPVEGLRRYSFVAYDRRFTDRFCQKTKCDGWGYQQSIRRFHPELVLCRNTGLKRGPIEYRWDQDLPECVIRTKGGRFQRTDSTDLVDKVYFSRDFDYERGRSNRKSDQYQQTYHKWATPTVVKRCEHVPSWFK